MHTVINSNDASSALFFSSTSSVSVSQFCMKFNITISFRWWSPFRVWPRRLFWALLCLQIETNSSFTWWWFAFRRKRRGVCPRRHWFTVWWWHNQSRTATTSWTQVLTVTIATCPSIQHRWLGVAFVEFFVDNIKRRRAWVQERGATWVKAALPDVTIGTFNNTNSIFLSFLFFKDRELGWKTHGLGGLLLGRCVIVENRSGTTETPFIAIANEILWGAPTSSVFSSKQFSCDFWSCQGSLRVSQKTCELNGNN